MIRTASTSSKLKTTMRSFPRSLPLLEVNGRVPLNFLWSAPISTTIDVIVHSPVEDARKVISG